MIRQIGLSDPAAAQYAQRVLVFHRLNGAAVAERYGLFVDEGDREYDDVGLVAFADPQGVERVYAVAGPPMHVPVAAADAELAAAIALTDLPLDLAQGYTVMPLRAAQPLPKLVRNDLVDAEGRPMLLHYGSRRYVTWAQLLSVESLSQLLAQAFPLHVQPQPKLPAPGYVDELLAAGLPVPDNELARLAELYDLDVLDTSPEAEFDNITQLASTICGTPMAVITLIDAGRQWFKAQVGLAGRETPRQDSVCQYVVMGEEDMLEVADLQADRRFRDLKPVVDAPNLRYYAGVPLRMPSGNCVGTLCVLDSQTRTRLSERERAALHILAREATHLLERRRINRQLQHANHHLQSALTELQDAQRQLVKAHEEQSDSIHYARRIQTAALPPAESLRAFVKDSYILYEPKRIVSGDFYWFGRFGGKLFLAVGDCTGHGVPGAFLSFIGVMELQQAVSELWQQSPGSILARLDERFTQQLRQTSGDDYTRDSMDISLCMLDLERRRLQFAGAKRDVWVFRGDGWLPLRGTRQSIGGADSARRVPYETTDMNLLAGDELVLLTDGIADQFGGAGKPRRMGSSRLRSLLQSATGEPLDNQLRRLQQELADWRGNIELTDDVLVMRLRIP